MPEFVFLRGLRCDPCDMTLYMSLQFFRENPKAGSCIHCCSALRWLP